MRHMTNPPRSMRMLLNVADKTVCIGEVMAAVSLDRRLVSSPVATPSKYEMSCRKREKQHARARTVV
jgi:hypothetical protein